VNWREPRTWLRLGHVALALGVIAALTVSLVGRRESLAELQRIDARERTEVEQVKADIARRGAQRDGLRRDDPYVVEYLARERLNYIGPGEFVPPPPVDRPASPR
jgi:cell division protein FtsB